jgi:exonuclease SbcC
MQRANVRAKVADSRAKAVAESLAKLEVATPPMLDDARVKLETLVAAGKELPDRLGVLETLEAKCRQVSEAHTSTTQSLDRMRGIEIPEDLATLEIDRNSAAEAEALARTELAAVLEEGKGLEERKNGLPALAQLEALQRDHGARQELATRLGALDLPALAARAKESMTAQDVARAGLETARVAHAAHDLRQGLSMGDPCPVCGGAVGALDDDLPDLNESIELLRGELKTAEERAGLARGELQRAEGEAKQIERQIAEVASRLELALALDEVTDMIEKVGSLEQARLTHEQTLAAARENVESASLVLAGLEQRSGGLAEALLSARDRVAAEEPPLPDKDPIEAWRRFEEWLAGRTADRSEEVASLELALREADETQSVAVEEQRVWLEGLGIAVTDAPGTDLALAEARQRADIDAMEKTITHAAELEDELKLEQGRTRIASALGNHLKSNNFEAWLLEEAMEVLIEGANGLLDDLSAGAYSLKLARGQFEVIDHRNADLTRTTRSLSGGETFLVSLSLALSMADQLAELTGTSSRLESVFLDEGFGSLDQESLDVVASVLDELVGKGRTVGIVTHVRELADRIPVRFEVTKGAETASISRVGE